MNIQQTIEQRVATASRLKQEYHPKDESSAQMQVKMERLIETLFACAAVLADQEAHVISLIAENSNLHTHAMALLRADLAVEKRRTCVALGVAGTKSAT